VQVTDVLPEGLSPVVPQPTPPTAGWYNVATGVWDIGSLGDGLSATLTIVATVDAIGSFTNVAAVTAADQFDPNLGDNASSWTVIAGRGVVEDWVLELDVGLNLISLPLIPNVTDIVTFFTTGASNITNVNVVQEYEPPGPWRGYIPASPGTRTLNTIEDGKGYWVNIQYGPITLSFAGVELPPPPGVPPVYVLGTTGWNLLGFKSAYPRLAGEYLAAMAGKYVIIYGFKDGAFFIVQNSDLMEPGLGYWIALTDTGVIYP
jgi:hypothetical protein